jgi:flavin-dependent dehydrogenase
VLDQPQHDVIILGGGLAGLTLAIQLLQATPALRVLVLERRKHPLPAATHKVGESTVEIGANYLDSVLGLKDHLQQSQLKKFGFRFFFSEGRNDIDRCTELGVSELLPAPSWQLDRGRFENFLGEHARAMGIDFRDAAVVRGIELGEAGATHQVEYGHDGAMHRVAARWVVDASGRAGLLKRKLGLAQANGHDANAAWWRVDGKLDINDWSSDPQWLARCDPPDRWRSTNHLCGPGYWFWLIPLASGSHSLGIVCDAAMHPLETMNTHDKAMAWLREYQPQAAAALEASGFALQDFRFLRGFSHGCKQVFSADRWALTGEAGVFLDPFYSPGSDFIALSNTYVSELVAMDRAGEPIATHAQIYQLLYFSFYENSLTLYRDQYPIFGNALVMPLKIMWDYTYYWALLAPVFFGRRQAALALLNRLKPAFLRGRALNLAMQALLRDWGLRDAGPPPEDRRWLDQYRLDWARAMNRGLTDELDDDAFLARIEANVARMAALATDLLAAARQAQPRIDDHGLEALCADAAQAMDEPLLPPQWYAGNAPATT